MKKLTALLLTISAIVLLAGCGGKAYVNKTYGYSITVPQGWGAIQPFDGKFVLLYDTAETIGPEGGSKDNFINMEVFTATNSARNAGESWPDFYKRIRLNHGEKYTVDTMKSNYPVTDITLSDAGGKYEKTCRLIEGRNNLYVFCFNLADKESRDVVGTFEFRAD
jgi:hypothetical protein